MSLRVLQVVSSSKTSGAERHVFLLTQMLLQRGHQVSVVCPPDGWLVDALRSADIEVHEMAMRKASSFSAYRRLWSLIRRERFDVVHTHLTRATYHAGLVAMLRRVPVLASVHVFSRDLVFRLLAARGSKLIAVSESVRSALRQAGISADRIEVVYNGTDFVDAAPATDSVCEEFGLSGNGGLVGLVGRVAKEKGHLVALGAAKRLQATHPDLRYLFVGRMVPGFEPEFREALERSGLGDRVVLTGDRSDVPRLMDAMDIVMLPSEKESFGLVAVEAMARGKPIIATRVGGLSEVIRDNETGLLIEQDEAQLASAIDGLLADPERRRTMGETGRAWVRDNFSHTRMVERIEEIYLSLAPLPGSHP